MKNKQIFFILIIIIAVIFLITSQTENKKMIYGVCIHPEHYDADALVKNKSLQALQDLGVSMVREDVIWNSIETSKGFFDFTYVDRRIDNLRAIGVDTLPILTYGNILYANIPPGTNWRPSRYTPPLGSQAWEDYKVAFSKFIYASVKHLSDKYGMVYFEIWNEPYGFWEPDTEPYEIRAIKYVELMRLAYPEAKRANPNAQILIGGLGSHDYLIRTYITPLYQYGIKDYFDIMNIHPYCDFSNYSNNSEVRGYSNCDGLNNIETLRNLMKLYGDEDKRWWVTEIGIPSEGCSILKTTDEKGYILNYNFWCPKGLSEQEQALRLKNFFKRIKTDMPFIDAVFWYDLREDCNIRRADSNPTGCLTNEISNSCPIHSECRFGIINRSSGYKPAFYEYQNIIQDGNK